MASLTRERRGDLARVVAKARKVAEIGARAALEALAVHHQEPWQSMSADARKLRNRLRAHGRQLGDRLDQKRGTQTIDHLVHECAYEHWHRMLFSRFLAECDLLIEPNSGVAISLDECRELAAEQSKDWLSLATEFAVRMLPQIFRTDDPVLEVTLTPEIRHELEGLLKSLSPEIFRADDSLGWVYQFWQAEKKEEVNASGNKIGAAELPAVTQLFTEDYMVDFLLHNTLGAWWTAKRQARGSTQPIQFTSLRLKEDGTPDAGAFEGWPNTVKELRVLDPCMGSGHFLVFALNILVRMRVEEENLSIAEACALVLKENLYGLELDPRCTQIAAFNLALAAWRMGGYQMLPPLNVACSGLEASPSETDWVAIAGKDEKLQRGMEGLHELFRQAPVLGSLINPRQGGNLLVAEFEELQPLLEQALQRERTDDAHEIAVTAQGVAKAAEILASEFTLVATNVPYLGRPEQCDSLKEYCDRMHRVARTDLAACFIQRCLSFCSPRSSIALVTPQSWLFQPGYKKLRQSLLEDERWIFLARLGPRAFETISGEQVNVCLLCLTHSKALESHKIIGIDVTDERSASEKRQALLARALVTARQEDQLKNPDARISLEALESIQLLSKHAVCIQGLATSDDPQFTCFFWEFPRITDGWEGLMGTVKETCLGGGRERLIHWQGGTGRYYKHAQALKSEGRLGGWKSGTEARGRKGVLVSQMSTMPVTLYTGEFYDRNASVIVSDDPNKIPAIWAFASSTDFAIQVRKLDRSLKPSNSVFVKVPFDLDYWQKAAAERYPNGLPSLFSNDATQWLFSGHPAVSAQPLQVAVARLLGYRWPRQTGSNFPDCPAVLPDGLEELEDGDGIICLEALRGELPAADRVRSVLARAYGDGWSPAKQNELLAQISGKSIEDWLRDSFFEQHCSLFQNKPFVWHIWDGLKNGFNVLVNYHKLAAPDGSGRKTLEKLIYTYLGQWIEQRKNDQKNGVEGADLKLASGEHLRRELENILHGEPPYDIFARWKPLHEQPIGWEPDMNDGVRINIRPFMTARPLNAKAKNASILRVTPNIKWEKDRGKEPDREKEDFPWFWSWDQQTQVFPGGKKFDGNRWNSLHYTRAFKEQARKKREA